MKRAILFLLALAVTLCSLVGCAPSVIGDLSETKTVMIRELSQTDDTYSDYIIYDEVRVGRICDFFSGLALSETSITEPMNMQYTVRFIDERGAEIAVIILPSGHNAIDLGGELYSIGGGENATDYIEGIIAGN